MGLTSLLVRVGARRPHVLLVPTAGATGVRLAAEAELDRRGWPRAGSPANADLLVVAGRPGPRLGPVVDAVWEQVPEPRARVVVERAAETADLLDAGAVELAATPRRDPHPDPPDHAGLSHGRDGMEMPGGLPMADLGEDRDGLMLDRLHVPLGPILPDWPAGLVVRATLQGDVVQEAEAEFLDAPSNDPFWDREDGEGPTGHRAARELDGLARILGVAGWTHAAARAHRLRDGLLGGRGVGAQVADLLRRVRRSRTLRWSLRGINAGTVDVAGWVEHRAAAVEAALADPRASQPTGAGRVDSAELARLLVGAELAAVRLIVAAVDPQPASAASAADLERGERYG